MDIIDELRNLSDYSKLLVCIYNEYCNGKIESRGICVAEKGTWLMHHVACSNSDKPDLNKMLYEKYELLRIDSYFYEMRLPTKNNEQIVEELLQIGFSKDENFSRYIDNICGKPKQLSDFLVASLNGIDKTVIVISEKYDWEVRHCMTDNSMQEEIREVIEELGLEEESDAFYAMGGRITNSTEMIAELVRRGFSYNAEFEAWIGI